MAYACVSEAHGVTLEGSTPSSRINPTILPRLENKTGAYSYQRYSIVTSLPIFLSFSQIFWTMTGLGSTPIWRKTIF